MRGFDAAWLADYQARQAKPAAALSAVASVDAIEFTLRRPLPLLNEMLRMHWAARRLLRRELADEIALMVPGVREPFERAAVTVTRYGMRPVDPDNLCVKHLLDVLQPRSERHPNGLGLIRGDDPARLTLSVIGIVVPKADQRTTVRIARL